jgi:hypothetical protein
VIPFRTAIICPASYGPGELWLGTGGLLDYSRLSCLVFTFPLRLHAAKIPFSISSVNLAKAAYFPSQLEADFFDNAIVEGNGNFLFMLTPVLLYYFTCQAPF